MTNCHRYAPPVQPFHSSAMYQPSTDKVIAPCHRVLFAPTLLILSTLPQRALQIEYKAFHQYRDDFDTANIM